MNRRDLLGSVAGIPALGLLGFQEEEKRNKYIGTLTLKPDEETKAKAELWDKWIERLQAGMDRTTSLGNQPPFIHFWKNLTGSTNTYKKYNVDGHSSDDLEEAFVQSLILGPTQEYIERYNYAK
jgi:hypothetical protein